MRGEERRSPPTATPQLTAKVNHPAICHHPTRRSRQPAPSSINQLPTVIVPNLLYTTSTHPTLLRSPPLDVPFHPIARKKRANDCCRGGPWQGPKAIPCERLRLSPPRGTQITAKGRNTSATSESQRAPEQKRTRKTRERSNNEKGRKRTGGGVRTEGGDACERGCTPHVSETAMLYF